MLPYGLFLLIGIHTPGTFNLPLLIMCLFLWIFAVFCAIIQLKVASRLSWHDFLEGRMELLIELCNGLCDFLLWADEKWKRIPERGRAAMGLAGIFFFVVTAFHVRAIAYVIVVGYWLIAFFIKLHSCLFSCKRLVVFWLIQGILLAFGGAYAVSRIVPNDILNPLAAYSAYCILLVALWVISAGVADYEVAKMAGQIINTITTILLLAFNVLFSWCKQHAAIPLPGGIFDELIYFANLLLLPLVASGYLAALFVEGRHYIEERCGDKGGDPKQ